MTAEALLARLTPPFFVDVEKADLPVCLFPFSHFESRQRDQL
jgi:hypothetical protein